MGLQSHSIIHQPFFNSSILYSSFPTTLLIIILIKQNMHQKEKAGWDFDDLLTPKIKTLDLLKTPRNDHVYQMMYLANSCGLKEEQSQNESYHQICGTLTSPKLSLSINQEEQQKNSVFDSHWLPHRAQQNQELECFEEQRISKKLNFEADDQEDFEFQTEQNKIKSEKKSDSHTKPRNKNNCTSPKKSRPKEKGLRNLSDHCYKIVQKQVKTNYKAVANQLIQEMKQDAYLEPFDEKQEQNIKRRVYDALNVLIALGVLDKRNKQIYYLQKSELGDEQSSDRIGKLKQDIKALKEGNAIKNLKIQDLKIKKRKIYELINRNKEAMQNHMATQNKMTKQHKILADQDNRIDFPFVGVYFQNISKDEISFESNKVKIKYHDQYQFFGDLDAITCIRLNKKPMIIFKDPDQNSTV